MFVTLDPDIAIEVAIHRMGNRPDAKIPEKWERKWKMAPRPTWPKNGHRDGKMAKRPILGSIFPFRRPFFGHLRAWSHFLFSVSFLWDFCVGPVSHSVYGHFDRNPDTKRLLAPSPVKFRGTPRIWALCQTIRVMFQAQNLHRANGRGGFGSQTAADPPLGTPGNPRKADCGYGDGISQKLQNANPARTFELSQCRHCKERQPEPRKGFWVT